MFGSAFQSMRLGIVCYILPFAIIFNPALILMGKPLEVMFVVISTLFGCVVISAALSSYLLTQLSLWQRIFFFYGGIVFIFPARFDFKILGLVLCIVAFVYNISQRKKTYHSK